MRNFNKVLSPIPALPWITAAALVAGCAVEGPEPEATPDLGEARSALAQPIALAQLPSLAGLTAPTALCAAGQRIAIVVPFAHPTMTTDLALARNRAGLATMPTVRLIPVGGTPAVEPSPKVWSKVARTMVQSISVLAENCAIDIYEATSPTESALGAAANAARLAVGLDKNKVVVVPFGFDESTVLPSFRNSFLPVGDQLIVAPVAKIGSVLTAPAVYSTVAAIGEHALDPTTFAPRGTSLAVQGLSTIEARPAYQAPLGALSGRSVPDASQSGEAIEIYLDGVLTSAGGSTLASAIASGQAVHASFPAVANLWGATIGTEIDDITVGPLATPGYDALGRGSIKLPAAFQ